MKPLTQDQWNALDAIRQAEKARRSLREFVKGAYSVLEPHTDYKESILGAGICEHLEAVNKGHINRLLISAPPRHGKSVIVSCMWGLHTWINAPHTNFLCTSFKSSLAEDLSMKTTRIFNSEWYQNTFAKPRNLSLIKETIEYIENNSQGYRRCSAYESCTGFGIGSHGAVIVDDPIPPNASDEVRKQYVDQFHRSISNRAGAKGSLIVVGQRTHIDDLIGALDRLGTYEHICLPAEYDPKRSKVSITGWKDPRTIENEPLWPEGYDAKKLAHEKRYDRHGFEAQFNQAPVRKGGNVFNPDHFQSYTTDTFPKDEDLGQTIITVDCSFKDTKNSDYVVAQVWTASKANYYLRDQVREQADFVRTLQIIVSLRQKWTQARAVYVEEGANGHAILASLKHRMSGILPIKHGNASKISRYQAIAPLVEARNVYIPKDADWREDFLLEMGAIPNSRHDDQADAMAMALSKLELTHVYTDIFGQHVLF